MDKADTPHRWFPGWRTAERPPQDDPADLGTAFGLDMSMCDSPSPPPAVAPAGGRRGWMQRLAVRRKPTA
jgi:hypothetical protein